MDDETNAFKKSFSYFLLKLHWKSVTTVNLANDPFYQILLNGRACRAQTNLSRIRFASPP